MSQFNVGQSRGNWDTAAAAESTKLAYDATLQSHLLDPGVEEAAAEAHAEHQSHSLHRRIWRRLTHRS